MLRDTENELTRELNGRVFAYNRVFERENQFTAQVLVDLAKFCRANESTFHSDPRIHAALEGRREVWLRIQEYLNLGAEEIIELHRIRMIKEKK